MSYRKENVDARKHAVFRYVVHANNTRVSKTGVSGDRSDGGVQAKP